MHNYYFVSRRTSLEDVLILKIITSDNHTTFLYSQSDIQMNLFINTINVTRNYRALDKAKSYREF